MEKRTAKQIEKDCKRIKEATKTAKTFKDIEEKTGLTYPEIITSISKHPIISKRIREQLDANKQQAEREKELERRNKAEQEREAEQQKELDSRREIEEKQEKTQVDTPKRFVIDASITGVERVRDELLKICLEISLEKSKILLTSITIKELERMQKFNDTQAADARYILALAAEKDEIFESVLIDEKSYDTPDDCIIAFCSENNDVILLTSDKTMALKARMYGVQVRYMKQTQNVQEHEYPARRRSNRFNSRVRTLIPAKREETKLLITEFHTPFRSIRVCSDGVEYNEGVIELKIGDDIYIATRKKDYVTFAHYRLISLYSENNCELIFSRRFYSLSEINLENASYKAFLKDFKLRHNL